MKYTILLIVFFFPIGLKAYSQNVEIDTIFKVGPYREYLEKSNYLVELIAKGETLEALKIYNKKGNFFQRGKEIMRSFTDFRDLIDFKKKKICVIKTRMRLPGTDGIPPHEIKVLTIQYLFPSIYKGLFNEINIDYPLISDSQEYEFDMLFYKASDEYETIKKIEAIPVPEKK